jgi:hypothetical protein
LLCAAAVILVGAVIVLGWTRAHYNAWAWQSFPDRFHICDRDYVGPGSIVSIDEVSSDNAKPIGQVRTFVATHEVWGIHNGVPGDRCGTLVFVRSGARSFRVYGLSGGP